MKITCLSIENPTSYLVASGIKKVENRSWATSYRGPIYIHSSGEKNVFDLAPSDFPKREKRILNALLREIETGHFTEGKWPKWAVDYLEFILKVDEIYEKSDEPFFKSQAIIGKCELVDIVKNDKLPFSEDGQWHWILEKAELLAVPIINVKGRLRLWTFETR